MYPTAEVVASIAFGVIMVLLSLVSIYQAALYAARIKCGAPSVCYELEAGLVVAGELGLAKQAEEDRRLDLVGVGSWSATTLHLTSQGEDKDDMNAAMAQDTSEVQLERRSV